MPPGFDFWFRCVLPPERGRGRAELATSEGTCALTFDLPPLWSEAAPGDAPFAIEESGLAPSYHENPSFGCWLVNRTAKAIRYRGPSPSSPNVEVDVDRDGTWERRVDARTPFVWTLPPKSRVPVWIDDHAVGGRRVRVGILVEREDGNEWVWSEPVAPRWLRERPIVLPTTRRWVGGLR